MLLLPPDLIKAVWYEAPMKGGGSKWWAAAESRSAGVVTYWGINGKMCHGKVLVVGKGVSSVDELVKKKVTEGYQEYAFFDTQRVLWNGLRAGEELELVPFEWGGLGKTLSFFDIVDDQFKTGEMVGRLTMIHHCGRLFMHDWDFRLRPAFPVKQHLFEAYSDMAEAVTRAIKPWMELAGCRVLGDRNVLAQGYLPPALRPKSLVDLYPEWF